MKKIIAILLSLMLVILFVGCKDDASSSVQNDEQSKTQTSSENKQTETAAKELSDDQLVEFARIRLGVPNTQDITYKVGEKFYWDAGGKYLKQIDFYKNGETVAGASVDVTNGEIIKNIQTYDNGSLKSLSEALLQMIDGAYKEESKFPENCSTVGMCELADKYTKKWKEIADEYYDKIMAYDEDIQLSDAYYSTDDLHTFVSNMKTSWEKYNKEQCENYVKVLETIYPGSPEITITSANYAYELQKEWAIKLVEIYEQL